MVWLLLINLLMGLWVLGISYSQAMFNTLEFYRSTLTTIYHAGATAGISAAGMLATLIRKRAGLPFLLISSVGLAGLPISCGVSQEGYPGGDDGGAFGWMCYVGGSCLLALVVGCTTAIVAVCLLLGGRELDDAGKSPG